MQNFNPGTVFELTLYIHTCNAVPSASEKMMVIVILNMGKLYPNKQMPIKKWAKCRVCSSLLQTSLQSVQNS